MSDDINDSDIRRLLRDNRNVAMVGTSPHAQRDSYSVMGYLQRHGYRVFPVNPTATGQTIHGETVYASLAEVPEKIDIVDVFRRSDAVAGIVDEIVALPGKPPVQVLWLQLGVVDRAAAARARAAGIEVVMNRCMRIEHRRLM